MTSNKLYGGKATLYFDEEKHVYSLDQKQEKIIPGVTSVTSMVAKPALIQWAANCAVDHLVANPEDHDNAKYAHRKAGNEAATSGTKAHKWIENYIKGEEQEHPENPEIMASCFAFLNWLRDTKPKFIHSEKVILSQKYGYAGTLDFTCKQDNKLILGDFKTSKAIYPEYFMETAARVKALEEETGEKYDAMMIVRVGKDGKYSVRVETDIDKYFKAFLGALELYKCFKM